MPGAFLSQITLERTKEMLKGREFNPPFRYRRYKRSLFIPRSEMIW